ncbi:MAG: hypothetical protein ACC608_03105 [Anaerofustis sp.]
MERLPLDKGMTVVSNNHYIIDQTIGSGASCIVYDAHFFDSENNRKNVKLKECYPLNANIERDNMKLVWGNKDVRDESFKQFDHAYREANKIQNDIDIASTCIYSLDIFEYNQTKYIVTIPREGLCYDKNDKDDLFNILSTTLALTNVVSKYHKNGYLHLDIKPSNFLTAEDHTGRGKSVYLFDLDTLTSLDAIKNNEIINVPYSSGWAAPEQLQQKISKLCPATDLFSIGAILFQKIMNRTYTYRDISPFAEWEFEDERFYYSKVNPKIKTILSKIFHYTLAANIKRRYQTAEALCTDLETALNIVCDDAPYIIPNFPISSCDFFGRENEIIEIEQYLDQAKTVFIRGNSGIGKSELTKRYAITHKSDYDAIVYLKYEDSIIKTLQKIQIYNIDNEDCIDVLKAIGSNLLIILDNYDVSISDSNDLATLLSLNCSTIITTRTDFTEIYVGNCGHIFLEGLPDTELEKVFENEANVQLLLGEKVNLKTVFLMGRQCTYFLSMIAKFKKNTAYTIQEICVLVNEGLPSFADLENITSNKDNEIVRLTVTEAMRRLFKLYNLSELEKELLEILFFVDCLKPNKSRLRTMFKYDKTISAVEGMNQFNVLLERGFIQVNKFENNEIFYIHEILKEAIAFEWNPTILGTKIVADLIEEKFFVPKEEAELVADENQRLQDELIYKNRCLFSIIESLKTSNNKNLEYLVELLFRTIGGSENAVHYSCGTKSFETVMHKLEDIVEDDEIDELYRIKASITLESVFVYQTRLGFIFEKGEDFINYITKCEKIFFNALTIIQNTNSLVNDIQIIKELCAPIIYLLNKTNRMKLLSAEIIEIILILNSRNEVQEDIFPWRELQIMALKNPAYQKKYLQNAKEQLSTCKNNIEREKLSIAICLNVFSNGAQAIDFIDAEHKVLFMQIYINCKHSLEDLESLESCVLDYFGQKYEKSELLNMIDTNIAPAIQVFKEEQIDRLSTFKRSDYNYVNYIFVSQDFENVEEAFNELNIILSLKPSGKKIVQLNGLIGQILREFKDELVDSVYINNVCDAIEATKKLLTSAKIQKELSAKTMDSPITRLQKEKFWITSNEIIINCLKKDEEKIFLGFEQLLLLSENLISIAHIHNIIYIESNMLDSDVYFWSTVNYLHSSSYTSIALSFILKYTSMLQEKYQNHDDYSEVWLYDCYNQIVRFAIKCYKDEQINKELIEAIFGKNTKSDYVKINYYNDIINAYTVKINNIINSEFDPLD